MKRTFLAFALMIIALAICTSTITVTYASYCPVNISSFMTTYASGYTQAGYTPMTDFAGNVYYYVNLNPHGYVIAHANSGKVVEACLDDYDPYDEIEGNGAFYYAGLSLYYKASPTVNGVVVNKVGSEHLVNDVNLIATSTQHNLDLVTPQTPDPETVTPNTMYTHPNGGRTIQHYEYFDRFFAEVRDGTLRQTSDNDQYYYYDSFYGAATNGNPEDKGYAELLAIYLAYLDAYYCDSVIDDAEYMRKVSDSHITTNLNKVYNTIGINDVAYLPLPKNELKQWLLDIFGSEIHLTEPYPWEFYDYSYPSGEEMCGFLDYYMRIESNYSEDYYAEYEYDLLNEVLLNEGPVIIGAGVYNAEFARLDVKAYYLFYKMTSDGNYGMLFDPYTGYCVYNIGTTRYDHITLSLGCYSHEHNYSFRLKNKGCMLSYLPCCGYTICDSGIGTPSGDIVYSHSNRLGHAQECCSRCESLAFFTHTFTCLNYTASNHTIKCTICNYTVTEGHILQNLGSNPVYCGLCPYMTTTPGMGEIPIGSHDGDHEGC